MAKPIAGPATRVSALDRLLDVEARLEARLAAAHEEGDARVAAAEALMKEHHAALEAELAAARSTSSLRIATDVGERTRALGLTRDETIERLDRLGRERLGEMVSWLADEVIADIGREDRQ